MNLGKALTALKFDNRMKDWNLSQGLVTQDELSNFDSSLEDVSARCAPLDLDGDKAKSAPAAPAPATSENPNQF